MKALIRAMNQNCTACQAQLLLLLLLLLLRSGPHASCHTRCKRPDRRDQDGTGFRQSSSIAAARVCSECAAAAAAAGGGSRAAMQAGELLLSWYHVGEVSS